MNHRQLTDVMAFENPYGQLIKGMLFSTGIIAIMTGTHILYMPELLRTSHIQKVLFVFAGGLFAILGVTLSWIPQLLDFEKADMDLHERVVFSTAPYAVYGLLVGILYHHVHVVRVIG